MAYIDPSQDPDNQQNNNPTQADQALGSSPSSGSNQPTQPTAPPTTGGGGGGANAGSSPASSNNNTGGTQASGTAVAGSTTATPAQSNANSGWTNLDQYLNANTDQATQMGQQIAGSVNTAGTKAQSDISDLGTGFNSAVNQNTVQQNQGAVNQAITDATTATAANPNINASDLSAYQTQANANYTGPTDVTAYGGYNQAQQDTTAAEQAAQETQSEAGRGTLLNSQYENASANGYTAGENNLDQMLLQNSTGAQAALQPEAQQWAGLTGALGSTVSSGDAAAQQAALTDQATSAAAQSALGTASTNFQTQLNAGLANLQQTNTNSFDQVQEDLQAGTLSAADYAALGIDPNQHVYGLQSNSQPEGTDLSSYLSEGNAPTLATYATGDQYAQAAALAQLAGQGSSSFLNPSGAAEAGTAETTPAYTYNSAKESSDNTANQALYTNGLNNLMGSINNGFGQGDSNLAGPGTKDLPTMANWLNQVIARNGNGSNMANQQKTWATNQLQAINNLQTSYGFAPFEITGQAPVEVIR